jgi:hypothetical protein
MRAGNPEVAAWRPTEFWATSTIKTTRVAWNGIVEVSANEALAAATPARLKACSVVTFLHDVLSGGPVPIEERGVVRGKDQLDRAKKKLGVVSFKEKVLQGRFF